MKFRNPFRKRETASPDPRREAKAAGEPTEEYWLTCQLEEACKQEILSIRVASILAGNCSMAGAVIMFLSAYAPDLETAAAIFWLGTIFVAASLLMVAVSSLPRASLLKIIVAERINAIRAEEQLIRTVTENAMLALDNHNLYLMISEGIAQDGDASADASPSNIVNLNGWRH